jgi:lysozyme
MIGKLLRKMRARGNASTPVQVNEAAQPVTRSAERTTLSDIAPPVMSEKPVQVSDKPLPPVTHPISGGLTVRAHMEVITHEAIVLEAYRDSKGIWTWGVGVTNKSGHQVHPRYLRNPQSLTRCLEVYEWLVRTKYLPEVRAAFGRVQLNEAQLAAALSFHWNTGAIHRASWVKSFRDGNIGQARTQIMQWRNPPEIIKRREAERDLFFDGRWTSRDNRARIIHRVHANGNPDWRSARMTDISAELADVLARAGK